MTKYLTVLIAGMSLAYLTACTSINDVSADASQTDGTQSVSKSNAKGDDQSIKTADSNEVDEDRIICKRRPSTGSRFVKKECRTWRQWKALEQNSRDLVNGNQRAARFTTPDGGGR